MKKLSCLARLVIYEVTAQASFFITFFAISALFLSAFVSAYMLPHRLSEGLDRYAGRAGILDIVVTCESNQEANMLREMPVFMYEQDNISEEYPVNVIVYAENMSDYMRVIKILRQKYIYYDAVYYDEAQSMNLIRITAYMMQIFFSAIVILIMDYTSVNMYLQKRKYFLAVLKTQGMTDGQLNGFISLMFIALQTISLAGSNAIVPHINAYIKRTVEDIFPYIEINMNMRLRDHLLCWSFLVATIMVIMLTQIISGRKKNICLLLNRGEE